ncbi:MAG: putative membrane protein, partial [Flavobacteriaceae bacterium]
MDNIALKRNILIFLSILFLGIGLGMSIIPPDQFIEAGSIIAVIIISLPAFFGLYKIYGKRGITAVLILGLLALTIETIGIHTGFPYSPFKYIMEFGYLLFGTTPWTVFIAWSPLVIGSFLLSQVWFKKIWSRLSVYLGILVSTDVILDPGAVARGLWQYSNGGAWFGVPLQNFLGWVLSGVIAYLILIFILRNSKDIKLDYIWLGSLSLIVSIFLWA